MTITDQELADAIRERFPFHPEIATYSELGMQVHDFCQEHPPPLDIKPGDKRDYHGSPVEVVGWNPHPVWADQIIVVFDSGTPMTIYPSELEPRGNQ